MRLCARFVVATNLMLVAASSPAADEVGKPVGKEEPFLTVRLVDEQGKPVADARAGIWVVVSNSDDETPGDWNFRCGGAADKNGVVQFREGAEQFKNRPVVIARHAEHHLVGIQSFAGKDRSRVAEVILRPECHVRWRFTCSQLEKSGQTLGRLNAVANFEDMLCFFSIVKGSTFHALLPPGKFNLGCNGLNVNPISKEIEIKAGQRSLDLGARDLDAKQFILLEGKPAPELDDFIDWKNGPPLKLAELRGKIVLLEFWGWWCGSCVERGIPELFKLQDEFQGKDLVIIGIHTPADESDEIDSVAKLDDKLAQVRETIWKGRDIEFPVAMSRVKIGSYSPGEPTTAASKICFDYGVSAFPTTVLIDRAGKVVGRFDPSNGEDRAKLRKLLDDK